MMMIDDHKSLSLASPYFFNLHGSWRAVGHEYRVSKIRDDRCHHSTSTMEVPAIIYNNLINTIFFIFTL
jgi:hypothetical protein